MAESLPNVNETQKKAVEYDGGRLLIVAGPGTGKTHTLTLRIARRTRTLSPGQKVLAITFTNKSSEEMQDRLKKTNVDPEKFTAATFHRFCLTILREYISVVGLPAGFQIALPEIVEEIAKELWPQKTVRERKQILWEISKFKTVCFRDECPPQAESLNAALRTRGLLDFDDLLLEALRLLENHRDVREAVRAVYRNICVDEYQDINAVQHALLKILAGPDGQLTAIGDPNQAIYGFRGSDVQLFQTFPQDFPGAEILSLSENYRSAAKILTASTQIIAGGKSVHVPELTARIYQEGQLTIHAAASEKAEAEYVVHQIEKLVGGTSMFSQDSGRVDGEDTAERSFGDIAILYRLNSQARALKEAIHRSGIPYQIAGEAAKEDVDEFWTLDCPSEKGARVDPEKVALMSLHASKGLEFPVVFIVGCEENLLPLNLEGMTADAEEERRLFYVGMTRAKERLYLIRAHKRMMYGKSRTPEPSPFLHDIEEELKEYAQSTARKKRKKDEEQMSFF